MDNLEHIEASDDFERLAIKVANVPFESIEILRRRDGRHVRLSNGRRNRAVGRYASIKMGATIPWESRLELHDLYRTEVDPAIFRYFVQPETLFWRAGNRSYRYTPDRLDILSDGNERIVEIKDVFDPSDDPEYTEKLAQAARIYNSLGRAFELREGATIRLEPSFSAVEEVQAYRRAVVTGAHVEMVLQCLRHGPVTMYEVLRSIRSERPRPILFALMVRGFVEIDLSMGLNGSTLVSLVRSVN